MSTKNRNQDQAEESGRPLVYRVLDDVIVAAVIGTIITSLVLVGLVVYEPRLLVQSNPLTRLFLPVTAAVYLGVNTYRYLWR